MMTEHQSLQHQHEQERQAQFAEQRQEQDNLLQQQHAQFQDQQALFFRLQNEYNQEPTPIREHELLMLQQAGQHAQEMFTQQQRHLLERHQQDQLRLQERHWHQEQLLIQKMQQQQQLQQHQQQHQQYPPNLSLSGTTQLGHVMNNQQQQQQDINNQHHGIHGQHQYQYQHQYQHQHQQHPPTQNNEPYEDAAEAMDVDDEVQLLSITSTIANFRQHTTASETVAINAWASGPATLRPSNDSDPDAIVVFDTNVLISHLNFLQSFIQTYGKKPKEGTTSSSAGEQGPCIIFIIPWVVVQELDGLKSGGGHRGSNEIDLRGKAQRAIRYLQDELGRPDGTRRLRGQKISEHIEKQQKGDDSILDCCRYFRQMYPSKNTKVTLFSNDRNLCVKAMIHEIKTISRDKVAFELRTVFAAVLDVDRTNLMEQDDVMLDGDDDMGNIYSAVVKKASKSSRAYYRTEVNDREIQRIKATSKVVKAPDGMDPMLFDLTNHVIKNLRRYFEFAVPDHLAAYYGDQWKSITNFEESRVKEEDRMYDCRRLSQPFLLLQRYWRNVFSNLYGPPDKSDRSRTRLDSLRSFVKNWDRVQTYGLGKVYKKDLAIFLEDVEDLLTGITTRPVKRKGPSSSSATAQGVDTIMDDSISNGYYDASSRTRLIKDWKDHCKALHG